MVKPEVIAAIATAPGRGGIGVIRISGASLNPWLPPLLGKQLRPRQATFCDFLDANGHTLDQGIAIFFPAPNSFTGEDVLELQGHGGNAVLQLILARCLELGARLAAPGEFTQRAFLNNKIDLAQAEAVVDLIDAATAEGARSAMRSLTGEFSAHIQSLVAGLIELRMTAEASIDFPEEQIDFLTAARAQTKLAELLSRLDEIYAAAKRGSLLKEGLNVVLIGPPNAGKSSLLNQLAGEDLAIVTAQPGTTRDTLHHDIAIDGVPLHIIDTAGLREGGGEIEALGMARTWAAAERAAVALIIVDGSLPAQPDIAPIIDRIPRSTRYLKLINKIDIMGAPPHVETQADAPYVYLSAKTGAGIDLLRLELLRLAGWQSAGEGAYMARTRHFECIAAARSAMTGAAGVWQQPELFAEELRRAQGALNQIVGEFSADELLGEIFSRFCIGK